MKKIITQTLLTFCLVFAFSFLFTTRTEAFEIRQGDQVVIEASETFDGSLFVAGQKVVIGSKIDGDLYCAGQQVTITGEVTGDVLCAAQNLEIKGKVGGDIRSGAQTLLLDSVVSKNVNLFAQDITLGENSMILGELYTAAQRISVEGQVLKSWGGAADSITLNGKVSGEAQLATDDLVLGKDATVAGGITRLQKDQKSQMRDRAWSKRDKDGFKFAGKIMGLVMGLIYGSIILWLFPAWLKKTANVMETVPGKSALWGLLIWLVAPILIVLSAITIVGIPLALVLGLGLALLGALTWVVAASVVGSKLMNKKTKPVYSWLVGYLILSVMTWIPVINAITSLAVVLIGTGAIKLSLLDSKKK